MSNNLIAIKPLAVLSPKQEPRRYTLAEYLRREERANIRHEYYDGIIQKQPMAKAAHNIIIANVTSALKAAKKLTGKKYVIFCGQQLVYLPTLNYGLYPDVLVVVETPTYWDKNQVLLTNPVLIVEVASRSTRKYDRTDKFDEYQTLESFKEYVLIEAEKPHIETRFREDADLWRYKKIDNMQDKLFFKSLDISIDLTDIYEDVSFKS